MITPVAINRVKDIYEIIIKFYALPVMARHVIGSQYINAPWEQFVLHPEDMSDKVILRVFETKDFVEFSNIVKAYQTNEFYGE